MLHARSSARTTHVHSRTDPHAPERSSKPSRYPRSLLQTQVIYFLLSPRSTIDMYQAKLQNCCSSNEICISSKNWFHGRRTQMSLPSSLTTSSTFNHVPQVFSHGAKLFCGLLNDSSSRVDLGGGTATRHSKLRSFFSSFIIFPRQHAIHNSQSWRSSFPSSQLITGTPVHSVSQWQQGELESAEF